MMLMDASCPSKRLAAVTKRTGVARDLAFRADFFPVTDRGLLLVAALSGVTTSLDTFASACWRGSFFSRRHACCQAYPTTQTPAHSCQERLKSMANLPIARKKVHFFFEAPSTSIQVTCQSCLLSSAQVIDFKFFIATHPLLKS
jgi:hypothetical protein